MATEHLRSKADLAARDRRSVSTSASRGVSIANDDTYLGVITSGGVADETPTVDNGKLRSLALSSGGTSQRRRIGSRTSLSMLGCSPTKLGDDKHRHSSDDDDGGE